jgi:hypothetical protein
MAVSQKEIMKRWEERVVANGWEDSAEGARSYLEKYGKNISNEKLQAFADYARSECYDDFADEMEEHIKEDVVEIDNNLPEFTEFTFEQVENDVEWCDDSKDFYMNEVEDGTDPNNFRFVETTFKYLGKLGMGVQCGTVGNKCFEGMAEKMPNVRIRCLIDLRDNTIPSPFIFVNSESEGEKISRLCGKFGGSLRCDFTEKGWTYFETE